MKRNLFAIYRDEGDPPATPPTPTPSGDPELDKLKFTPEQQDFLNKKLAAERRTIQAQNQKTIDDLKKLQAKATTTEKERQDLQSRIEDLQKQHLSKEELAKQELENRSKESQRQLEAEKVRADNWQNLYHDSTKKRTLLDEAIAAEAFNPNQIVRMLLPDTRIVEVVNEEGVGTGEYLPRVNFSEWNEKENKTIVLDITVKEAITKMKNSPDQYGNLFKSTLNGGLGGTGAGKGGSKPKDAAKMPMDEYLKAREKDKDLTFVDK